MPVNDQIKKTILNEVQSMSISDFQNAVDESRISGNTVIDEMVENLVDYLFEQRSACLMWKLKNNLASIRRAKSTIKPIEYCYQKWVAPIRWVKKNEIVPKEESSKES